MEIYHSNIEKHQAKIPELESKLKLLSLARAVSFFLPLIVIIYLANERMLMALWVVAPLGILGFAVLLMSYNKVNRRKKKLEFLIQINEQELLRFDNKLSGFPQGQNHLKYDHHYLADMDVFGSHSLFQLLNRTTTESGSVMLANWLSEVAPTNIIVERQQSILELQLQLKWRQDFQAAGLPFTNTEAAHQQLLNWIEKKEHLLPKQRNYLIGSMFLAILFTVFGTLFVINSFSQGFNFYLLHFLAVAFVNIFLLRKVAPSAEEIIDDTYENVRVLGGYEQLAQSILSHKFQSDKLVKLQSGLKINDSSATKEIKRLRKILEAFQLRGTKKSDSNKFYLLFNSFWLLDIYYILKTENWKYKNRKHVYLWIDAISEFEVLSSLAGFAYSNPDFTFPEIAVAPYTLRFEKLGHPLIKSAARVCNDFTLEGEGQIAMITGSNMAGKSTFLRTIGVNLILAQMGAPCCAQSAEVSQLKMFTSMRTQDNLEEGVSSFYAELKRVEELLKLIKSGEPIFFMLDEMFKGTNSQDRYKGGVSLIKQLSQLNAFGLISTHDLELAKLAGNHMIVSNYSFNSKISKGELLFTYNLDEGICTDFNASELMRKSGIKLLNNIEKMF